MPGGGALHLVVPFWGEGLSSSSARGARRLVRPASHSFQRTNVRLAPHGPRGRLGGPRRQGLDHAAELLPAGRKPNDPGRPGVDDHPLQEPCLLRLHEPRPRRPRGGGAAEHLLELVEPQGARRRAGSRARGAPSSRRPAAADLLGHRIAVTAARRSCADDAGSRASSSTSPRVMTGWNVISSRTSVGTSSRSARLRSGRITSVSPAAWAASTFCFTPPIGRTRPWSVTSPVIPTVCLTGRSVSSDASAVAIVMPALGPSFGIAPAGTWTWNVPLVERRLVDAELLGVRPDVGERDAADSFMTSPSWPVSVRPPRPSSRSPRRRGRLRRCR